ncbi:MAG: sensor histidine kinase, partial [Chloroflexi bacterium]
MRTLRSRLILSHILPILVVVPLVGIALLYLLETQVVLNNLSEELARQAALTARMAALRPDIWQDVTAARFFVTTISTPEQSQVMLLDPQGRVIMASTSPNSDPPPAVSLPSLASILEDGQQVRIRYDTQARVRIAEILVPIIGPNHEILGIIRMTRQLSDVTEQVRRLRYIIGGVLVGELVLGAVVGLVLALDIERSLRRVTQAIYGIATGRPWRTLPEKGPREFRLLLRTFNTLVERLRMMEEARRRLLANLVHEISRPMGALQAAVEALLNGADEDAAFRRELLEGMNAELDRLQPLLANLTDLHDQVLGTLELNRKLTNLNTWLQRTVVTWREAAQAKGLHWQVDIQTMLPTLEIDADRLAQALGNLLSNAIKYTEAGGSVTVTAEADDGEVRIRVQDTGVGIAPEMREKIFEPFFRTHPGKRFPQGLGLGLTIANDLVTAHGGRLEVESEPGQGSRFTIHLPLEPNLTMTAAAP